MEATVQTPMAEVSTTPSPAPATGAAQKGTLLCQINGKPWHYTKASGIITADRKTGVRTALITFKKKLDKGSESIQLYYDAKTFVLKKANAQLKFPKEGGGRFGGIYELRNADLITVRFERWLFCFPVRRLKPRLAGAK